MWTLGMWTEQDLNKTQRETAHLYLAQAVSQVLHTHAVHADRKGTVNLLIEAHCNHFMQELRSASTLFGV